MEAVIRAAAIYFFVLVVFRLAGKRTLAQVTTFDFVLLLIIGEATQQALLGDDFSVMNAFIVVGTLIGIEILVGLLESRFTAFGKVVSGTPVVLVENGVPIEDRMKKLRIGESDVLEEARMLQGLERMDQIKYAVLERTGGISIVPMSQ